MGLYIIWGREREEFVFYFAFVVLATCCREKLSARKERRVVLIRYYSSDNLTGTLLGEKLVPGG